MRGGLVCDSVLVLGRGLRREKEERSDDEMVWEWMEAAC